MTADSHLHELLYQPRLICQHLPQLLVSTHVAQKPQQGLCA
jgi:hypothetical protein